MKYSFMSSMEQPPIPTVNQRDLDFESEPPLETLTTEELETRFEKSVGYSAHNRFFGMAEPERRQLLIDGTNDPKKGFDAVAEWDRQYDDKPSDAWKGK